MAGKQVKSKKNIPMIAKILNRFYPILNKKLLLKYPSYTDRVMNYWEAGKILETKLLPINQGVILKKLTELFQLDNKAVYNRARLLEIRNFYKAYPEFREDMANLSWSHWQQLMRLDNEDARNFYAQETHLHHWTVRQLRRQIASRFYERICFIRGTFDHPKAWLKSSLFKAPYIFEFTDLKSKNYFSEKELENALLEKVQDLMLELGGGLGFVGQQQMLKTESGKSFYIDLVFYHYHLKCFVIIDLKVGELKHADIGQMDMYKRLFDVKMKRKEDQDTIGIIICTAIDPAFWQYSMLADHSALFASIYFLQIPNN